MKNNNFIGVGLCLFLSLSTFAQELIITGIYDGPLSGGTPKGVELYVQKDTPDLSVYGLGVANNGDGSDGMEFTFPTESVSKGTFIYVTTNLEQFETYFGFPSDYQYDSSLFLGNGEASLKIACNGGTNDVISYDDGATFPDPNGASMELATDKYSHIDYDFGEHWSEATEPLASGGDFGTPGFANSNILHVSNINEIAFGIYPNPTKTKQIFISTESTKSKKLFIFDVLGKKMFSKIIKEDRSFVDLQHLKSGIYILKLIEGTKMSSKKLIIQ